MNQAPATFLLISITVVEKLGGESLPTFYFFKVRALSAQLIRRYVWVGCRERERVLPFLYLNYKEFYLFFFHLCVSLCKKILKKHLHKTKPKQHRRKQTIFILMTTPMLNLLYNLDFLIYRTPISHQIHKVYLFPLRKFYLFSLYIYSC